MASALVSLMFVTAEPVAAIEQAPVAPAKAAVPSCMTTRQNNDKHVRVTNECNHNVRAKIVISFGRDGACRTYRPGDVVDWTWTFGQFDGLGDC